MSDLLLTPEERDRFATWLEREAETTVGLIAQMETLPGGVPEVMAKKMRTEALAQRIVAKMLRELVSVTI